MPKTAQKYDELPEAELEDLRLSFLIHDVSRMRRTAFDLYMKPHGVTRSQWWVLSNLSRHDGMMQTELAAILDVGKVTVGGLVERLEQAGWVERRPDTADRRAKRVHLTAKARQLLDGIRQAGHKMNELAFDGLSRQNRRDLFQLLSRIKDNLKSL
ncbi:MarR family transcriptional regulator [Emcibacter sp. SYSU 3D8]|uniref:MarR family winged helix-turn-helix transcriptional regulator n=1 Tax=Emcibacter sp. SYSU 3D8 TaxID=3133969 RepID=UPI0031FE677D